MEVNISGGSGALRVRFEIVLFQIVVQDVIDCENNLSSSDP